MAQQGRGQCKGAGRVHASHIEPLSPTSSSSSESPSMNSTPSVCIYAEGEDDNAMEQAVVVDVAPVLPLPTQSLRNTDQVRTIRSTKSDNMHCCAYRINTSNKDAISTASGKSVYSPSHTRRPSDGLYHAIQWMELQRIRAIWLLLYVLGNAISFALVRRVQKPTLLYWVIIIDILGSVSCTCVVF